jgi:hypothetical protein
MCGWAFRLDLASMIYIFQIVLFVFTFNWFCRVPTPF